MQYLGIEYQMKYAPKLDPTFIPFGDEKKRRVGQSVAAASLPEVVK